MGTQSSGLQASEASVPQESALETRQGGQGVARGSGRQEIECSGRSSDHS